MEQKVKDSIVEKEVNTEPMVIADTKRILLRQYMPEDFESLVDLFHDKDVIRFKCRGNVMPKEKISKIIEDAPRRMRNYKMDYWSIISKKENNFVGYCGLLKLKDLEAIELGFSTLPSYRQRGYATEASIACMKYGFEELELDEIIALIEPYNQPAKAVVKKLGMELEKQIVRRGNLNNYFVMTKERFQELSNTLYPDFFLST